MKQGENFEKLVAWINHCLHNKAVIVQNDQLVDKYTGKKRQIDVTIRITEGPTEFLAIVEARERSRPVGVSYIEEINQKKESVNAHLAIIISNTGFYKTALQKTSIFGIKTFSLKEALKEDWSQTQKYFKGTWYKTIKFDNATLYFLDPKTNSIINPHKTILDAFKNIDKEELVFTDINSKPFKSILNVVHLTTTNKNLWEHLEKQNGQKVALKVFNEVGVKEKAFFIDENGDRRPIEQYCLVGNFWIETKFIEPKIIQYESLTDNKLVGEIIDIDNDIKILIENPDDIDKDRRIHVKYKGNKY